jgi:hypothetical protein
MQRNGRRELVDRLQLALEVDRNIADDIAGSFMQVGAEVTSASKRNLDGTLETVIQLVDIAVTAGAAVVPLILPWTTRKNIRKIRVGDIEIENPSEEQVEELWERYLREGRGEP